MCINIMIIENNIYIYYIYSYIYIYIIYIYVKLWKVLVQVAAVCSYLTAHNSLESIHKTSSC